ncbi:hypothetical protein EJP82_02325 [Paenibacillus anaericanus]|uniref:Uncharacterized protein n=1 Tax=Paenibacillus anaericanus TaxID=170367 RepID=A0A3S1BUV7_9BACL|nr:hypothetical protein [Paenibacillus anaericanus]RUT47999.1 hypothetical protein EJP82_02325 [Paenibacillus anaericanus]
MSPSNKYKLKIEYYEYEEDYRRYSYSKGTITNSSEQIVSVINRNYGQFPFLWIEKENKEYLLCGIDYQGYTIVDLQTGKAESYVPDTAYQGLGFCWAAMYHRKDNNKVAVEGCIWAHEYEPVIYDFENPMQLPYKEILNISPYGTFDGWINETEFKYDTDKVERINISKLKDGPDYI